MKTKIRFISVVAIIFALTLMITACGETSTNGTTGTGEPITTATMVNVGN